MQLYQHNNIFDSILLNETTELFVFLINIFFLNIGIN